jgi:pimeloyl-ACP methyl ester carboxylesterase
VRIRAKSVASRFRGGFRRQLDDPTTPLSLDMGSDSSTLLIAFGGMHGRVGMLPFEFFRATGAIPVKRLFVRDLRQAWYHRGIPGHGSSIEEVADALRALAREHGAKRIVMAGNSAGGYAAMLFGTLLPADTVLAFAPQTVLDAAVLADWDDHRWDEQLTALTESGDLDTRFVDLRPAIPLARELAPAGAGRTRYEVYYDGAYEPDRLHAERLEGIEGVRMHRLEGGMHGIAREMRESGELDRVLQGALVGAG